MPYPKKLLNDYEELAVDLHPHWWYFAEAVCALVVSIVLGIFLVAVGAADWLKWVAVVLIVLSALWLLVRYCKWVDHELRHHERPGHLPARAVRQERHRDPARARRTTQWSVIDGASKRKPSPA